MKIYEKSLKQIKKSFGLPYLALHKINKLSVLIFKNTNLLKNTSIEIRTDEFFLQQTQKNIFNRFDTIVRLLAIENFYNKNNFGWELYKKMQANRVSPDYINKSVDIFKKLIISWEGKGYQKESKIICDKKLQLVDGSHRLALSIFFKNKYLSCTVLPYKENIKYDLKWFIEHDFTLEEINLIDKKYIEICNQYKQSI
jgi:hypothetical protein